MFDLGDGTVLKIPYNNIGIRSNELEYENFMKKPEIVAKIIKYENNLIIQEKLDKATIVPYVHTRNGTVKEYLLEQGIDIDEKLLGEILNTKVQIGIDKKGAFKFFDYEDAKIDHKDILEMFRMKEENIDQFFKYVHEYDINHITEKDTFEDYRKHEIHFSE